jgi:hypothetical protein
MESFPEAEDGQSLLRSLGIVAFFNRWISMSADSFESLQDMLNVNDWNARRP